jgi:hypothetical protein
MFDKNKNLIVFFLFFLSSVLFAQDKNIGLFEKPGILEITIYADHEKLLNDVGEDRNSHNAFLVYFENGTEKRLDIELKTRGNFRRQPDICSFPPMRVNFKKKQIEQSIFENCDKIKMVTHCNSDDKNAADKVYAEYLVYKIYNKVNNLSYRVRLLDVVWVDIFNDRKKVRHPAFFIEKTEMLAKRNSKSKLETKQLSPKSLHPDYYHLFAVFQFLIGNTDWSVLTPKNLDLLASKDSKSVVAVPFDFDLSEMVCPSYAEKTPGFGPNRKEATINAYCETFDEYRSAVQFFIAKKQSIYKLIANFEVLGKVQRNHMLGVLGQQYRKLEDPELLVKYFRDFCDE